MNDENETGLPDVAATQNDRRRLLTLLGVGGAAALAGPLAAPRAAHAGHDLSNTFHLGEQNSAPAGAETGLSTDVGGPGLSVANANADGNGLRASSDFGTGVIGLGGPDGTGVLGVSGPNGMGVHGESDGSEGIGGLFESASGTGLAGHSQTGLGISGDGGTGWGVLGQSTGPDGIGVRGQSEQFIGVDGHSDSGTGVSGDSPTGEGVNGSSQSGTGVHGESETGVGVTAVSSDGLALNVDGAAAFSTAGSAQVPAGQDSVFVAHPVTGDSHVSVTLTSDPGVRSLAWVERDSNGSGFTVHLSPPTPGPGAGGPGSRPATSLTYLVIEPAT